MNVAFHPEALEEFEAAAKFFAERQPGLQQRFIENVQAAIARVQARPESFRVFDGDVRRCLTQVFPYAVLYSIEAEYVLIVAVMHCRRDPGYWRHRQPS